MCSAIERPVIERLLSELSIPAKAKGEVVLEVHEGVLCHLKLTVRLGVSLRAQKDARTPKTREQRVQLRNLSIPLQSQLQELADENVGRHGKLRVEFGGSFGGSHFQWEYVKARR